MVYRDDVFRMVRIRVVLLMMLVALSEKEREEFCPFHHAGHTEKAAGQP